MPLGARPTPPMVGGAALHPDVSAPSQEAPCITERLAGPSPPSLSTTKMELVVGSTAIPHGAGPTVTCAGDCPHPLVSVPSQLAPLMTDTVSPTVLLVKKSLPAALT